MTITDQSTITDDARSPLKLAGFLAIALGVLALFSPFVTGLVVTFVLGANFLVGGVSGAARLTELFLAALNPTFSISPASLAKTPSRISS